MLRIAVVDGARGEPVAPAVLLDRGELLDEPGDLVPAQAVVRQLRRTRGTDRGRASTGARGWPSGRRIRSSRTPLQHGVGGSRRQPGREHSADEPGDGQGTQRGVGIADQALDDQHEHDAAEVAREQQESRPRRRPARVPRAVPTSRAPPAGRRAGRSLRRTARTRRSPRCARPRWRGRPTPSRRPSASSSVRRRSRIATSCGSTAAPTIPPVVMIAIR